MAGPTLIAANPQPTRIPKNHLSLDATANPPSTGIASRWRFQNGVVEARAIARSCRDLIAMGIDGRETLVLVSNQRVLLPALQSAFEDAGVAYEPPRAQGFIGSPAVRLVLAVIRIGWDPDDYAPYPLR